MSLDTWNIVIKGVSAAGAIVAVIFGIVKYTEIRHEEINIKKLEVKQMELEIAALGRQSKAKFLDQQFDKYLEAVSIAGRLATHAYSRTTKVRTMCGTWRLFGVSTGPSWAWWRMGRVAVAMGKFGKTLKILVSGLSGEVRENTQSQLRLDVLNLSHCVSKSLENNWSVKLNVGPCNP